MEALGEAQRGTLQRATFAPMGLDGSGGKHNMTPHIRTVGAGASVAEFKDDCLTVLNKAFLHSASPGKQTVPRAELYSICCVVEQWDGTYPLTIITDAAYTLKMCE